MDLYQTIYANLLSFSTKEIVSRKDKFQIVCFLIEVLEYFNTHSKSQQTSIASDIEFFKRFSNLCNNYTNQFIGRNLAEIKMLILFKEDTDKTTADLKELCRRLSSITKSMIQN
ncbi:hypothetical protein [Campylobacter sp. JMF_03 NE3]|uniref:hypothetical protein n=1 Tax=Campylobacter sp. JMF_03 NE3 TaxID=2983831 RepID=UPI0022EA031B|nr:hypothetical protein [Campylobacter sp. JMF_03 NE3]MDA3053595.1 hypothetical protein [Campylobacter sp. JMF_03 NE3]